MDNLGSGYQASKIRDTSLQAEAVRSFAIALFGLAYLWEMYLALVLEELSAGPYFLVFALFGVSLASLEVLKKDVRLARLFLPASTLLVLFSFTWLYDKPCVCLFFPSVIFFLATYHFHG